MLVDKEAPSATPAAADRPASGRSPEVVRGDVELRDLVRRYPGSDVNAVDSVSLKVREGEMFGLLGPSGCGKSTTLRMIAGLDIPDGGQIYLGDRELVDAESGRIVPAERRNMGMVFQSYAIWPHMTVEENVMFPLRLRRRPKREARRKVTDILELTGLTEVARRASGRISGGQQQRVALARALVYEPALLLLDEPLSNLDAALRKQMRIELRRIHQELALTVIFVTHDQDEAMSLGTRLAVMNAGRIEQLGTPEELYTRPQSHFVMGFLGQSVTVPAHFIGGTAPTVRIADGSGTELPVTSDVVVEGIGDTTTDEVPVWLACRPEDVVLVRAGEGDGEPSQRARGVIRGRTYLGDHIDYEVELAGRVSLIPSPRGAQHDVGDDVEVSFPRTLILWPRGSQE